MSNARIPDLESVTPECSLCGYPAKNSNDGGFTCDRCKLQWDYDGVQGERYDDSPECGEEASPKWAKTTRYRCVRGEGHTRYHYGVRVDEPGRENQVYSWPVISVKEGAL